MTLSLIQTILSLFLMLFTGWGLVKIRLLKPEDSRVLSLLSIYVVIPCSILNAFQVDFTPEVRSGLLLAFAGAILVHILLLILDPVMQRVLHLSPLERVSVSYSNAGNLIIPLVTAMMGAEYVIYASAYITVQLFLLWSHGKAVLCGEKGLNIKKIVSNINMIAIFAGILMLVTGFRLKGPVASAVTNFSKMIGPLAMLVGGMLIAGTNLKPMLKNARLWLTAALRLIVVPLFSVLLLRVLAVYAPVENADMILMIPLLATMTPSASSVMQMAQVYGKDAAYATAINIVTTLGCIITMPLILALYQL